MKFAFWQIKLDNYSSCLCTFTNPFAQFSFCQLPFSIKSTSEVQQKRNIALFDNIPDVHIDFADLLNAVYNKVDCDIIFCTVLKRAKCYND